jgi:hypothetical protein
MKNIRKILRVLGALVLASGSHVAYGQASGGNGTVQGAAANGANVAGNPVLTGGSDGTKVRTFKTDNTGQIYIANPGSGGGVVTQSDHTQLLGTSYQGGTWLDQIMGVNGTSIATAINPFPVSIQGAIPAGTNVIGHVIVDSAPTTAVTGTFWQATQPVSGTFWQATQPVSIAAALTLGAGSAVIGHVIADSGSTTAVTSLPALPAGTNVIGHVIADTGSTTAVTALPALPTGTNVIGHVINDASSAVIGHVIADTGSTTAVTGNVTAVQATGSNLHTVIDSGSTTVTQATGSNLHVQVDTAPTTTVTGTVTANAGTGTFAVSAASLPLPTGAALDATLTGGTQKTQLVNGSNAAAVDAAGNQYVAGGNVLYASLSAGALNADLLSVATAGDVSAYKSVSFQITASFVGTMTLQGSNDNSNFSPIPLMVSSTGQMNNTGAYGNPVTGFYFAAINCKYIRLRETAYTSGTMTGAAVLFTHPYSPAVTSVVSASGTSLAALQSGTWTVQPGNTPNSTPWLTTNTASAAGGYSYSHLAANATTTVKSGAGTLHSIVINTPGVADTITVYDNTSSTGTIIGVINDASASAVTLPYDAAFSTGLTVVVAGTTPPDVTILWK